MTNVEHTGAWRKSTFSSGDGQCVEVAPTTGGFAVRDSKNAAGGHLVVDTASWRAFLGAARGDRES